MNDQFEIKQHRLFCLILIVLGLTVSGLGFYFLLGGA